MKCVSCQQKFPTKGAERCVDATPRVCFRCSLANPEFHQCDMSCSGARPRSIDYQPLTSGWMGFGLMSIRQSTIEEFLPKALHYIGCTVPKIDLHLTSRGTIAVHYKMVLQGKQTLVNQVYRNDLWKRLHLEDLLKREKFSGDTDSFCPVTVVFPERYLRVKLETLRVTISGVPAQAVVSDLYDMVGLPDSDPPPDHWEKTTSKNYSYYSGKAAIVYAPLRLGEEYDVQFEVEALNFQYLLTFLFPYRIVDVGSVTVRTAPNSQFTAIAPIYKRALPMRLPMFPPAQEYNWSRDFDDRPITIQADPYRDHPLWARGSKDTQPKGISTATNLRLDGYEVLLIQFAPGIDSRKFPHELMVEVNVAERPLPVRVYEQMQKLPDYNDFLVAYDVINTAKRARKLEISCQIEGYTTTQIDNVDLPAMGSGRSARIQHTQCPRLLPNALRSVTDATTAVLKYEIYETTDGKRNLIERSTKDVRLLSGEQIVWSLRDIKSGMEYNLAPLIAAWVHPSDSDKLLDQARGAARKYHPDGVLLGGIGERSLGQQTQDIKALYDYLNNDSGVGYVASSFQFGHNSGAQRVLPPEDVLRTKSGVCIDLAVLFASLMEGLGINPLIFLTADHAFVGWGNKHKTSELGFVECTTIGRTNTATSAPYSFEESQALALKYFKDNFLFLGSEDPLGFFRDLDSRIVDLAEVRQEGIA